MQGLLERLLPRDRTLVLLSMVKYAEYAQANILQKGASRRQ